MTRNVQASRFGGFGVFCVISLLLFTTLEVGVLWWLDAGWFDSLAFWRGPRYERDVIFSSDPTTWAALDAAHAASEPRDPDAVRLFDDRAVEADYDPARGARLTTKEGGVIEFPPGSIPEAVRIRVAPIARVPEQYYQEGVMVAGPCYKILVGDKDHYQFATPIRATLKYLPEFLGDDGSTEGLAISTWQGGQWQTFPTDVNTEDRTLTAEVTHCSIVAVARWILGDALRTLTYGGLTAIFTTGRGLVPINNMATATLSEVWQRLDQRYFTKHFSIRYTFTGEQAVPADNKFPLSPKHGPVEREIVTAQKIIYIQQLGTPNFVVLLGEYLEQSYEELHTIGIHPSSGMISQEVYLLPLAKSLGETPVGGPMWITSRWDDYLKDADKLDALIRAVATHELIHVAQYEYFPNFWKLNKGKWWIEMTAAYLADLFWERQGRATKMVEDFYMPDDNGKLLASPMGKDDQEHNYIYASFLKRLESKGDILKVINQVNASGEPTTASFDAAVQAEFKRPLGEFLEEFAQDYYYNDLWQDKPLARARFERSTEKQAAVQSSAPNDFTFLNRKLVAFSPIPNSPPGLQSGTKIPPLTSYAISIHVSRMTEYQRAKLVVLIQPPLPLRDEIDEDVTLFYAVSTAGATLPMKGKKGELHRVALNYIHYPGNTFVADDVIAPGGTDRVTIIVTNRSSSREVLGLNLWRWGLLRPAWVSFERTPGNPDAGPANQWLIEPEWCRDCEQHLYTDWSSGAKVYVIKGHNLYWRKRGDKEFPADLAEFFIDKSPPTYEKFRFKAFTPDDLVFTVSRVDAFEHESYPAIVEAADPFQGTWEGKIALVEGSLAESILEQIDKDTQVRNNRLQAAIDNARNDDERARLGKEQKEFNEGRAQLRAFYEKILGVAEWVGRIGIPVKFTVRLVNGQYFFGVNEALGYETGMAIDVPLERVGPHTLKFKDRPDSAKPEILFRLTRPGEIRDDCSIEQEIDSKPVRYKLKWTFYRKQEK